MNAQSILEARQTAKETFDERITTGKVWQLSDDHFVALICWLVDGAGYEHAAELCKTELQLPPAKCPSKSALQRFWRDSGFRQLCYRAHRKWCAEEANKTADEARKSPAQWAEANAERIQQATFEMLQDGADPKTIKTFVMASLKLNQMDIEREKLRRDVQSKVDAGIEELAKTLPPEIVEQVRSAIAAKMEAAA